ncbi:MAG: response regulator receiver modulated diguanylate cyclase [Frankiales bacterium]|nr:response regulator receiver modulated diguanylate cyclase [Frankiales bacterium]
MTTTPAVRLPAQRSEGLRVPRVLVVDDSALIRAILVANLEDQGYAVVEAEDGLEALEVCAVDPPDVVLLDVVMPGLSGLEVLDRLQADPELLHVPVVCLTGRSDVGDIVEAMQRGAHDYLRKPFETSELLARLSSALRVKRLSDELRARNVELERVSRTDALTGLLNRRAVDEVLGAQIAHAHRHGHPLSVLMIDLDRFKSVNDTYGHAGGDRVLIEVASRLRAGLREGDTVGRWGGEEFLAVLPMTAGPAAHLLAERLCAQVAARPVVMADGTGLTVGISVGSCGELLDEDALLRSADAALYLAKAGGRGRAMSGS